jgi:subtilisin family serine protease
MKCKMRWQTAKIGIVLAAIMLAFVLAAMIGSTGAYSEGGPYNIIEKDMGLKEQKVLVGQDLDFRQGWGSNIVTIYRMKEGSIEWTKKADPDNTLKVGNDWIKDESYYVNFGFDPNKKNRKQWDACFSVTDVDMPLELKVDDKRVSSIYVETDLIIDIDGMNLINNDKVDLVVIGPDGQIKYDAINDQQFTNITVKQLYDQYGDDALETAGWTNGTYTFQIKTIPEYACGLEAESAVKELKILKRILRIGAEKNMPYELETVKLTVTGIAGDEIKVEADPLSEYVIFKKGIDDTPTGADFHGNWFTDVIDEDGIRKYAVEFNDTGTYTIKVTVTGTGDRVGDSDTVDIVVLEKDVTFDLPDEVVIGDKIKIKGTATPGTYVSVYIDDTLYQKLVNIVIEDGEFSQEVRTTKAGMDVPGSVRLKAWIDCGKVAGEERPTRSPDGEDAILVLLPPPQVAPEYVPGEVLVKFNPGVSNETINSTCDLLSLEIIQYFSFIDWYHLQITTNDTVEQVLDLLKQDPTVEYAEPNTVGHLCRKPRHLTTPNDPLYPQQWSLNNYGVNPGVQLGTIDADIDAPQAWEHITNSNRIVAVLDSGADYSHPDLAANIWLNIGEIPGNGVDDDGNGYVDDWNGMDFVSGWIVPFLPFGIWVNDADGPMDDNGHGTHVAGIIGAEGNNGIGITGVCGATDFLMIIKIADSSGSLTRDAEVAGIDYAIRNGVSVISCSFTFGSAAAIEAAAITRANAAGVLIVAAAGNEANNIDIPGNDVYPVCFPSPNIIGVAASNNRDLLWFSAPGSGSNWGTTSVDLVAPGEDILSLGLSGRYSDPECIYVDNDLNGVVSIGDQRKTALPTYPVNSFVVAGDSDIGLPLITFNPLERHDEFVPPNGVYDPGEEIYLDNDGSFTVSIGDMRLTYVDLGPGFGDGTIVAAGDPDLGNDLVGFENGVHTIYSYLTGTSMATPHVSGALALCWELFPGLTHLQIKDCILRRVDPRLDLRNTVVSGIEHDGRLRMCCGPDFGDAPDPKIPIPRFPIGLPSLYPTKMWTVGASHEDIGEEWLGFCNKSDVSPEFDADVQCQLLRLYDADCGPNILPGRIPLNPEPPYFRPCTIPDKDNHDDGVRFPVPFTRGAMAWFEYSICTENAGVIDAQGGRYGVVSPLGDTHIYVHGWIDWNGDGDWDDPFEHVYDSVPHLGPIVPWWSPRKCSGWIATPPFPVPKNAVLNTTWARIRLDYGEDAGALKRYDSDHPVPAIVETYHLAQYGEVEDYCVSVVEAEEVIFDIPSTVVIGDKINIQGYTTSGTYVDVYVDDILYDKLDDLVIEDGEFSQEVKTTDVGMDVPGSVRLKAWIDCECHVHTGEESTTDKPTRSPDGEGTILVWIPPPLTAELSVPSVALEDDFTVFGTAQGATEVTILSVPPKGGGGKSLLDKGETGLSPRKASVSTTDYTYSKKMAVQEDATTGYYDEYVLTPGMDGYWGMTGEQDLDAAFEKKYCIADLSGDAIATKTQAEIEDILEAMIYAAGSDDLMVKLRLKVETPYVFLHPVPDVKAPAPLVAKGTSNRKDGYTIVVTCIGKVELEPQTVYVENGTFSATFDTTDAVTGTYVVKADDGDGHVAEQEAFITGTGVQEAPVEEAVAPVEEAP